MTIFQLNEDQIKQFAKLPEVTMATQVGLDEHLVPLVIASGRIAIRFDGLLEQELVRYREFFLIDGWPDPDETASRTEAWAGSLPKITTLYPLPITEAWSALAMMHLGPRLPLPPVPYRPSYTHGHLPFHGSCGGIEKYYRYEQFPTSRRIDMTTSSVVATDTYGAPASEMPFTPTGLSAVGRFALPLLGETN
jgi:hypothetical protein